jgi:hypothetical protein
MLESPDADGAFHDAKGHSHHFQTETQSHGINGKYISSAMYSPFGSLTSITYGNGTVQTYHAQKNGNGH